MLQGSAGPRLSWELKVAPESKSDHPGPRERAKTLHVYRVPRIIAGFLISNVCVAPSKPFVVPGQVLRIGVPRCPEAVAGSPRHGDRASYGVLRTCSGKREGRFHRDGPQGDRSTVPPVRAPAPWSDVPPHRSADVQSIVSCVGSLEAPV